MKRPSRARRLQRRRRRRRPRRAEAPSVSRCRQPRQRPRRPAPEPEASRASVVSADRRHSSTIVQIHTLSNEDRQTHLHNMLDMLTTLIDRNCIIDLFFFSHFFLFHFRIIFCLLRSSFAVAHLSISDQPFYHHHHHHHHLANIGSFHITFFSITHSFTSGFNLLEKTFTDA